MTEANDQAFDKARFDAFMALAEFRQQRRLERNKDEWKFGFALWAFIAGATFTVNPRPPEWLLVSILIAIVVIHMWFNAQSDKRDTADVEMAFYYTEHAETLLSISRVPPRTRMYTDGTDYAAAMAVKIWELPKLTLHAFTRGDVSIVITIGLALSAYWLVGTFE
ncbi:MAG: hypothetical protein ABL962_06805 [Fimbriimonadaceae bacterium]